MNKVYPKTFAVFSLFASWIIMSAPAFSQISLPGFGQKNASSNDQRAKNLLHQHLPLDLDANAAYPTVPNEDLLGGPFQGRVLPITVDTLTKPLPPGDYVLPMTFFCSEYSIHRPGAGTAYVLAPAKGTAAKAISTLLWRGMLTGHKPQELQSVSWAIQGSVPYDKMPANYKRLIDQLIPDMKNQVNGQAFADIEDGFQGKVNRVTRKISAGISKGTGGFVHADIKVDVELNESFQRLGRLGKMALDGESVNSIVTAAYPSDEAREQALYAGQGTQAPPLPAANGPWSVMVPGVAYMRFVVHGGNLQGDNVTQIRILKRRNTTASLNGRPHLVLAQYSQSTPTSPSLTSLFGGGVNQAAFSQCQVPSTQQRQCALGAISFGGLTAYSVGTGDQAPIMAPTQPLSPQAQITPTPRVRIAREDVSPNRTAVGVGEIVDLALNGASATDWTLDPSTAGVLTNKGASGATFIAGDIKNAATVMAVGTSATVIFQITEPTSLHWVPALPQDSSNPTLHAVNELGIALYGVYFLGPDTVSFSRVRLREVNVLTTGTGILSHVKVFHCNDKAFQSYLAKHTFLPPAPCGNVPVTSIVAKGFGSKADGLDIAAFFGLPPQAFSLGKSSQLTLNIPAEYSVMLPGTQDSGADGATVDPDDDSLWSSYRNISTEPTKQQLTISDGTMTISKGDGPAPPPSKPGSDTNYLFCVSRHNNPFIAGAPPALDKKLRSEINRSSWPKCEDLALWGGILAQ